MVTTILPRVMQDGRTVPTPQVHALILAALDLKPGQKVLEVGTGSGTTAELLASACCECGCDGCTTAFAGGNHHCGGEACTQVEVHTIELLPVYGEVLNHHDADIYFHVGDGKLGLTHEVPFDVIVATCGCEHVPEVWAEQLKEGGKLVAPVGGAGAQRLILAQMLGGILRMQRVIAYVRFSMMRTA